MNTTPLNSNRQTFYHKFAAPSLALIVVAIALAAFIAFSEDFYYLLPLGFLLRYVADAFLDVFIVTPQGFEIGSIFWKKEKISWDQIKQVRNDAPAIAFVTITAEDENARLRALEEGKDTEEFGAYFVKPNSFTKGKELVKAVISNYGEERVDPTLRRTFLG